MATSTTTKKSRGRQKVEMVKMEKDSNRQVTFSKRRTGLFKKASELSTLCGAEMAIIVFSPGKKAFSFGHPSVEMIINRFSIDSSNHQRHQEEVVEHGGALPTLRNGTVCELNVQLSLINTQLEIEKKRSDEMNEMKRAIKDGDYQRFMAWLEAPMNDHHDDHDKKMELQQLEYVKGMMEELRKMVMNQGSKLMAEFPTAAPPFVAAMDDVAPNMMGFNRANNFVHFNGGFGFGGVGF